MSKWLHSVMKQSPANTQIQNIILPVWLQLDKTNFPLIAVDIKEDLQQKFSHLSKANN